MIKIAISPAAAGLLRALIARAGVPRDRILLTEVTSVDWQSLTFMGERHEIQLSISPPDSEAVAERLCDGLSEAEFDIPGQIVADISLRGCPYTANDGAIMLTIDALTIEE